MEFEWHEKKNSLNQTKHDVSFEEAKTVFDDVFARLITDPDHSINEQRYILLGMSSRFRLLVVCHSIRAHESIRIISARIATNAERKSYEGSQNA